MKKITTTIAFSLLVCSAFPVLATTDVKTSKQIFSKSSTLSFQNNIQQTPSVNIGLNSTELFHSKKTKGNSGYGFEQGTVALSLGYGFPNLGKSFWQYLIDENATNITVTGLGPLHFRGEIGLSDKVGFGASINYVSYGMKWTSYDSQTGLIPFTNEFKFSSLSILARMNVHFGTTEKLDPYFGVGAGYRSGDYTFSSNDPNSSDNTFKAFSPFGFEMTIGMRYYFTDNIGFYTELGIAKSVIQVGLAAKF